MRALKPHPFPKYSNLTVLLPAHNEEMTIADTMRQLAEKLPGATFLVCDNASTDNTSALARQFGARVIHETRKGKGYAVTRLFAEAEGDYFLLVDADTTYDPLAAPDMVDYCCNHNLDMVTGIRKHTDEAAYRAGHTLGNKCFSYLFSRLFSTHASDIFSGYRVFSRRFVKSFPVNSSGFEIETELSALATTLQLPVGEMDCQYRPRPTNSKSKLNTYRDGLRILLSMLQLFQAYRPLAFWTLLSAVLALTGLGLGARVVYDFIETGLVLRFPTAILATGLMLLAAGSLFAGLILDGIKRLSIQQRQLAYLALSRTP